MLDEGSERTFYRYVSREELEVIRSTGKLRGGKGAGLERTYWTEDLYRSAAQARDLLALSQAPHYRVAFIITNDPEVSIRGDTVEETPYRPGGGTEWMSWQAVEVELIEEVELDVD